MQQKYDDYSESGGSFERDTELRISTNNMLELDLDRVFGSESQYGQSLGVVAENAELLDGGLYLDPEKGVLKTFSWEEITGFPIGADDEDAPTSAEDAATTLPKTYADTSKTYKLIGARVPEHVNEDGEVEIEASSRVRNYIWNGEDDVDYDDFIDEEGEPIPFGGFISWYDGSQDNGTSATARRLAELLTVQGEDLINDEDDIFNWLNDVSGDNILREDLEGRRVRFFIVRRESENGRMYNYPVVEDVTTGEPIVRDNTSDDGDDSGN